MKNKVLYEANVSELKKAQRRKIISEKLSVFVFMIAVLLIMLYLLGPYIIIGFILAIFLFYPYPFIPNRYKITELAIICNEKRVIPFKKLNPRRYTLQLNKNENYVSIQHRIRGEFLRLYTNEPQKVHDVLTRLMLSPRRSQS